VAPELAGAVPAVGDVCCTGVAGADRPAASSVRAVPADAALVPLPVTGPSAAPVAIPSASTPTASAQLALREGSLPAGHAPAGEPLGTSEVAVAAIAAGGRQKVVKSSRAWPWRRPHCMQ
jgi:hypothetical protein